MHALYSEFLRITYFASLFLEQKRQRERDSPVPSLGHSRTSSASSLVDLDDEEDVEDNPPPSKKGKGVSD